ncbi:MerR family DNA-binding transcriptional regulator [Ferrimicrobium sp.]|nr:MerR family DNA-binding transcriptional regulator [Ferrimicrobium sp.]
MKTCALAVRGTSRCYDFDQLRGVHPMTLRRWETEGRIDPPLRTPGGRRRYDLAKLRAIAPHKAPSTRATIAYARVSTSGQKDDLVRQVAGM